jgi:hypothetical protein
MGRGGVPRQGLSVWVIGVVVVISECVYVAIDRKDGNSDVRWAGDSGDSSTLDVEKSIQELAVSTLQKIFDIQKS